LFHTNQKFVQETGNKGRRSEVATMSFLISNWSYTPRSRRSEDITEKLNVNNAPDYRNKRRKPYGSM
jgi:hypothetical protein